MLELAKVLVHASQFPEAVRHDLLESLRSRSVNHKFHYDSLKQTQKWLALHEAYSPARTDPQCAEAYQRSFSAAARRLAGGGAQVIGLGCGGGQKDTTLLRLLRSSGREVFYIPCDVSLAMVLVARGAALEAVPAANCSPLVCDLATVQDLPAVLAALDRSVKPGPGGCPTAQPAPARLFTFFGMIPNFEADRILPKLSSLLQPGDLLLLSANLAPGNDYTAGVDRVLPLYDNELTRDWLLTFLLDLGVERTDGELRFVVEETSSPVQLKRIAAYFHFTRPRTIQVGAERFEFPGGESVRLFFSYRHTPDRLRGMLSHLGLQVLGEWITPSQEEGVFLISRASGNASESQSLKHF